MTGHLNSAVIPEETAEKSAAARAVCRGEAAHPDRRGQRNGPKQMQVFLETEPGLSVDTAANGGDALKAPAERSYSVVVTDLKMPRVDGLQLLEEVQKRPVTRGCDYHNGIWNDRPRGTGDAAGGGRFSH